MARYRHDPSKDLVGFLVGDVMYAVRIEVVREIVNPLAVVDLPRAPATVKGVADYRGDVVPVIDLRERFGLPPAALSRKTKWIVLDVGPTQARASPAAKGLHVALVVDSVSDVFGLAGGELRPAPPLGAGEDTRAIEGVTTHASGLVFVLDAEAFRVELQALAAVDGAALGAAGSS